MQPAVEEATAMARGLLVVLASEAVEAVLQTRGLTEPQTLALVAVVLTVNPAVTVDQA
jgi:hypothetical protein